mgnify:CR=1 FL=1
MLILIVLATAKIHILKQFTTTPTKLKREFILCLLLQRYTFWSNSQPRNFEPEAAWHCACYCKDTHFEAIHNPKGEGKTIPNIVLATAKIHILKQFTTFSNPNASGDLLCLLLQRYTFWSNSQHGFFPTREVNYCACYCKDTHFEAIHNKTKRNLLNGDIVLATAKIHILKQFTTGLSVAALSSHCACYCKDTHFEAIHNFRRECL